jgi:hypothetical protein
MLLLHFIAVTQRPLLCRPTRAPTSTPSRLHYTGVI